MVVFNSIYDYGASCLLVSKLCMQSWIFISGFAFFYRIRILIAFTLCKVSELVVTSTFAFTQLVKRQMRNEEDLSNSAVDMEMFAAVFLIFQSANLVWLFPMLDLLKLESWMNRSDVSTFFGQSTKNLEINRWKNVWRHKLCVDICSGVIKLLAGTT